MSYPAPDSKVYVTVSKWDGKCLIAVDANTNQYIHWLDDDKRWEGVWRNYVGTENLVLLARVGRADGPRGRKMFVVSVGLNVEPSVNLPQPEPTRSLFDATDDVPRSPRDLVSSGAVTSTRNKQRKGDCSFTVSLPSEEDRILVNRLCEKAKEAGLVKHKGHYPGQHFKAWLLEQAVNDGLLQL